MVGFLVGALTGNDSHATQVGPGRWVRHGALGPKVNHSCDPNCGVRLNDGQAFDFVARRPIVAGQALTAGAGASTPGPTVQACVVTARETVKSPLSLRPPEVGTRLPLRFRAGPAGRPVVDGRRVGAPGWR